MEKRYVRDVNSHYLVLSVEELPENDYQFPMLLQNSVEGILPVHMQVTDGKRELYYEITSCQSLKEYYEARAIGLQDMENLFLYINRTLEEADRYLLHGKGIVLDPECIFIRSADERICFCYEPGSEDDESEGLNSIARFILDHISYDDPDCVSMAYRIFQESLKENISVSDFVRIAVELSSKEKKEGYGETEDTENGYGESEYEESGEADLFLSGGEEGKAENGEIPRNIKEKQQKKSRKEAGASKEKKKRSETDICDSDGEDDLIEKESRIRENSREISGKKKSSKNDSEEKKKRPEKKELILGLMDWILCACMTVFLCFCIFLGLIYMDEKGIFQDGRLTTAALAALILCAVFVTAAERIFLKLFSGKKKH